MIDYRPLLAAILGAALQELVHWYDIRNTLTQKRYVTLLRSPAYWLITALMVLGSSLGTWIWLDGENQSLRTFLITGAAFPLILKKAVSAIRNGQHLGAEKPSTTTVVASYFAPAKVLND